MTSQLPENNMELETPLKKRLYQLMTDDEKLQPFSFANRIGIGKSTFHSIWTKGSTSIHRSTAKKIADATRVNIGWLNKGIGEPYNSSNISNPNPSSIPQSHIAPDLAAGTDTHRIDISTMIEALTIVEDYLAQHDKRMHSDKKAELIVHIYNLLCKSPDAGQAITTVLKLAVKKIQTHIVRFTLLPPHQHNNRDKSCRNHKNSYCP